MSNRPGRAKREYRVEEKRSNKKKDIQQSRGLSLSVFPNRVLMAGESFTIAIIVGI